MPRLRPRFTVRTLGIFVTLIAMYFGAWEATKRYGAKKLVGRPKSVTGLAFGCEEYSPAPFVVTRIEYQGEGTTFSTYRRYYFWFFGMESRLPIEKLLLQVRD